jgi:GNAT superfamily N-acetyltransferase
MRKLDTSRISREILEVMRRGQGEQKCCVAFTAMNDHALRGTWGNGSVRFLYCMCKMLDGDMPSVLGTTCLTGIRAEKGYWTCAENLWPSNIDLTVQEFENWRGIPTVAWEDAKRRRIQSNRTQLATRDTTSVNIHGRSLQLLTNYCRRNIGDDRQCDIILLDEELDRIAWVQLRAYVNARALVLEDVFVKQESRRIGIGSELLRRIEQISRSVNGFCNVSDAITVPIPRVDIRLPDRNTAVREFFTSNGYSWQNNQVVPGREYSVFTASKQLPRAIESLANVMDSDCELVEGPGIAYVRLFNSPVIDAWQLVC